jgi:hypothetical protein
MHAAVSGPCSDPGKCYSDIRIAVGYQPNVSGRTVREQGLRGRLLSRQRQLTRISRQRFGMFHACFLPAPAVMEVSAAPESVSLVPTIAEPRVRMFLSRHGPARPGQHAVHHVDAVGPVEPGHDVVVFRAPTILGTRGQPPGDHQDVMRGLPRGLDLYWHCRRPHGEAASEPHAHEPFRHAGRNAPYQPVRTP